MLTELFPGLWIHEGTKPFFGMELRRRMTVVRLSDGRLWVHSPNALHADLRADLKRLGEVGVIIAPNAMHGFAIDQFTAAWPEAIVFATKRFPRRHPEIDLHGILGSKPEPLWTDVLDQTVLAGNAFFSEALFLHRASRTLIVTDLIENMRSEDLNLWGRTISRLFGLLDRPAPSPEHQMYTLDAAEARASLEGVRGWDFERIVIAHGPLIEEDAHQVFDEVVERLLGIAERRGPLRRGVNRFLAWCQ